MSAREFVADFETETTPEQTAIWAWALVELGSEDVKIGSTMQEFFSEIGRIGGRVKIAFHNLRFDGSFIVHWLLSNGWEWVPPATKPKDLKAKDFTCLIGDTGQWYTISMTYGNTFITFWDSLKLIPMSVKKIGDPKKGFGTKHQKTVIDYDGHKAGERIGEKEREYIANDVLVVKEALELMQAADVKGITIGSAVMKQMKKGIEAFADFFPSLDYYVNVHWYPWIAGLTADEYCRKFYFGGISQVDDENGGKELEGVGVLDYTSMYPSMMRGKSGNAIPCGKPEFFEGELPEKIIRWNSDPDHHKHKFWFARIRCNFKLKENHIPTIQIKDMPGFFSYREFARSSFSFGAWQRPIVYVSMVDWSLIQEQYDVWDVEWLDGCWYHTETGVFDPVLEQIIHQKENAPTLAYRTTAKLEANNIYGKFGTANRNKIKKPFLTSSGALGFVTLEGEDRPIYNVSVAAAITSYARATLIRAAQLFKDYHAFCYCDTDSIHYIKSRVPDSVVNSLPIHPTAFNHWKVEVENAERAKFVRAKTYVEVSGGAWSVTACGLSPEGKAALIERMQREGMECFKEGLVVPNGKRVVRQTRGGCVIVPTSFEIHKPKRIAP